MKAFSCEIPFVPKFFLVHRHHIKIIRGQFEGPFKVTRHLCCKIMQKSDPPCTFPSILKHGLEVELLRETCKRGVILQHRCLVTLSCHGDGIRGRTKTEVIFVVLGLAPHYLLIIES